MATDQIWVTQIDLHRRSRHLPFEAGRMHKIITRWCDGPAIWTSPRPGILIITSPRPVLPERVGREGHVRGARVPVTYQHGEIIQLAGIVGATRTQTQPNGRKKRVPLPIEDIPAWLERRLNGAARIIGRVYCEDLPPMKGLNRDGHPMVHTRVAVHTRVEVCDPEALAGILTGGIGHGKRFGTGQLLAHREVAA